MTGLYQLVPFGYRLFLVLASTFHEKAKQAIKGRKRWREALKTETLGLENPIWIHCASFGEFEDIRALVDQIISTKLNSIYLTFQSPTGIQRVTQYEGIAAIGYMPFDTKKNAIDFLEILKPSIAIFSRSEFWLNMLLELKRKSVPTYVTGFRITNSNVYAHVLFKPFYSQCFGCFSMMFCDDEETHSFLGLNFNGLKTQLTGNPRIDRIYEIGQMQRPDLDDLFLNYPQPIIVFGSLETSDLYAAAQVVQNIQTPVLWIIASHEVDEKTLQRVEQLVARSSLRLSALKTGDPLPELIIVDSVGILPHLYRYANLAIIGGGFMRKGIHNVVEPVIYGVPTACGPNHRNYHDALKLISADLLKVYSGSHELMAWITSNLKPDISKTEQLRAYINNELGASTHIFRTIFTAE